MSTEAEKPWPNRAYAWYVVALLVISYASGVVDRIVIGLLVKPIKEDLNLSDTEIGIIQGLAFALFYSLFTLPIGFLVDRWSRKAVVWVIHWPDGGTSTTDTLKAAKERVDSY